MRFHSRRNISNQAEAQTFVHFSGGLVGGFPSNVGGDEGSYQYAFNHEKASLTRLELEPLKNRSMDSSEDLQPMLEGTMVAMDI